MDLPVKQEGPVSDPTLFRAPLAEQKLVPGIARRIVQKVSYKQTDSDKVNMTCYVQSRMHGSATWISRPSLELSAWCCAGLVISRDRER